jgi:CBS domain-containing protein/uncharacterized protein YrrD
MTIKQAMQHPAFATGGDFQFIYFSDLVNRKVCAGKLKNRLGKLTDMVFALSDPHPEAVGLYLEHGWGKPTEFIPWSRVTKIDKDAIFVQPPEDGAEHYPPFVDQPGWLLVGDHLVGQTILDIDGRRVEMVNDVHFLESKGRLVIVHVDISFNGFLRRWGLSWLNIIKDQFIPWKYVQPLTLEDAGPLRERGVNLSVTREELVDLPSEDLADALEELSGPEQHALFSALDDEKAAETLAEAEPRAQRQIVASLRQERARAILSELSVAQITDLFSILPHDDVVDLKPLLSPEEAERVEAALADREMSAGNLVSSDFVAFPKETTVGEVLANLRKASNDHERRSLSYIYVVSGENRFLTGVVDLRELILAPDSTPIEEIMASPVVSATEDDRKEDLAELFLRYQYRMIPIVDAEEHILGVVGYNDIMKGLEPRVRA